jgi:hypothetical protein
MASMMRRRAGSDDEDGDRASAASSSSRSPSPPPKRKGGDHNARKRRSESPAKASSKRKRSASPKSRHPRRPSASPDARRRRRGPDAEWVKADFDGMAPEAMTPRIVAHAEAKKENEAAAKRLKNEGDALHGAFADVAPADVPFVTADGTRSVQKVAVTVRKQVTDDDIRLAVTPLLARRSEFRVGSDAERLAAVTARTDELLAAAHQKLTKSGAMTLAALNAMRDAVVRDNGVAKDEAKAAFDRLWPKKGEAEPSGKFRVAVSAIGADGKKAKTKAAGGKKASASKPKARREREDTASEREDNDARSDESGSDSE